MRIVIAIFSALALGEVLGRFILPKAPKKPEALEQKPWEDLTYKVPGGWRIGLLERLLFLAAFWAGNYTLIAGWLAFKVASKWETWKNIIHVPEKVENVSDLEWYIVRARLGSWILTRFWLGTLGNILIGLVSAYIGLHCGDWWARCK